MRRTADSAVVESGPLTSTTSAWRGLRTKVIFRAASSSAYPAACNAAILCAQAPHPPVSSASTATARRPIGSAPFSLLIVRLLCHPFSRHSSCSAGDWLRRRDCAARWGSPVYQGRWPLYSGYLADWLAFQRSAVAACSRDSPVCYFPLWRY